MNPLITVIANRYLKAFGIARIEQHLIDIQGIAKNLRSYLDLVEDLIAAGERRRVGRVSDINVGPIRFDGQKVEAKVAGTTGSYDTRITVFPQRGHHCTCVDWEKNGKKVGPCKHVLALGIAWKTESLMPTVDNIDDTLKEIVDRGI